MNPNYQVLIDVGLTKPVAAETIWLRRVQYLPFVPQEGQTIRLTSEDEENTLDLVFDAVTYDSHAGVFIVEITDDALVTEISEQGSCDTQALIAQYNAFGFVRLNFPTAQVVRA